MTTILAWTPYDPRAGQGNVPAHKVYRQARGSSEASDRPGQPGAHDVLQEPLVPVHDDIPRIVLRDVRPASGAERLRPGRVRHEVVQRPGELPVVAVRDRGPAADCVTDEHLAARLDEGKQALGERFGEDHGERLEGRRLDEGEGSRRTLSRTS